MDTQTQHPYAGQARRSPLRWLVVAGLVVAALLVGNVLPKLLPSGSGESLNTQVVRSVKLEEQVVLVSLGIQGIVEKNAESTIFGVAVPGTGRTLYLQYSYAAKLGIEGEDVTIEQTGDKEFLVTIPEFIFIGHDDEQFKVAVENNGVLSFTTPEIDTATLITEILSDDARAEHVKANREILEHQATSFYTGIIKGIDHDIDVDVKFRSGN